MSSTSLPIPLSHFTAALTSLPLSVLYAKHAELANATAHLEASNKELEAYARENNDDECLEAVLENREVMGRLEERREAIRREVVGRGVAWRPGGEGKGKGDGGDAEAGDVEGRGRERGEEGVFL